jgi:hypothetical protein
MNYEQKYLKYKTKYLNLKQQIAGGDAKLKVIPILERGTRVNIIDGYCKDAVGTIDEIEIAVVGPTKIPFYMVKFDEKFRDLVKSRVKFDQVALKTK